jgi:hypothetical protein
MIYKIYTITCMECGEPLVFSWLPLQQPEKSYCYLCMHNICELTNAFGLDDGLTTHDLYATFDGYDVEGNKRNWYRRVKDFADNIFAAFVQHL